LPPEDVAVYLKGHLDPPNAELGAAGTVFPRVKLRGGAAERVYRVEVRASGARGTELVVRDVTPLPKREKDPTITDEERWRRAGFHPDGTPLDRNRLR
ncbi:MAG: hypothetical protein FJ104_08265, partial [Deltaproteobacteria bacterium]|nr:hypothetical protein [Deltaproteobacteria bacterium]